MFGFKKSKPASPAKKLDVLCPVSGTLLDLSQVEDPVFSQKVMGEGFAIEPEQNVISAPVSGKAVTVFPTGHAVGIQSDEGVEVLVHIGIDTVSLNGDGFKTMIAQGDRVKAGQPMVEIDRSVIDKAGLKATTMVIFTGGFPHKIQAKSRSVNAKDVLIHI